MANDVPLPPPRPKELSASENSQRPSPDEGGDGSQPALEPDQERPLTDGEIALLKKYFKNSIDYGSVRVKRGKFIFFQPKNVAMTPNGKLHMPGGLYTDDYSKIPTGGRGLFVHESTHVWQYQQGVVGSLVTLGLANGLNGNKYGQDGPNSGHGGYLYDYSYHHKDDGIRDLTDYGYEQQAAIIQDYYMLINHEHCVYCGSPMSIDEYDNKEYGLLRIFSKTLVMQKIEILIRVSRDEKCRNIASLVRLINYGFASIGKKK